jgi:hypothetical protein
MIQYRKDLIAQIEKKRNTSVICYVGGDRQNVSTRIAPDIIPVFYEHLRTMDKNSPIDLFLYTKGGDVLTALRLVELIYEYTNKFSVLVPYKAYSSGTLICLGANEIVMTSMGELTPVDPSVTSIFNPKENNNASAKLPISVEDVYSFINLAQDMANIEKEEHLLEIFHSLVEHVHPLALGSVQRTYSLIRSVARKLLLFHLDPSEEKRISGIINYLTQNLFSHSFMISRREAKENVQLAVKYTDEVLEQQMWQLYESYHVGLQFDKPFIPEMNCDANGQFSVCSGIIESLHRTDGYIFEGVVSSQNINDSSYQKNVNVLEQGWKKYDF